MSAGHGTREMPCGGRSFRRLTGIRIWDTFESTTWHVISRAFRRSSLAIRLSGSSSYLTQSALLAFIGLSRVRGGGSACGANDHSI